MRVPPSGTVTTLQTGGDLILTDTHLGMQIRAEDMATNSQGSTDWTANPWSEIVQAAPSETPPWRTPWTATTRVVESGHSLVDDAFGDPWPGMLPSIRNSLYAPEDWQVAYMVRSTIPGSSTTHRWEVHAAPRDNADEFDALVITERGLDFYGVAPPDIGHPTRETFLEDIQSELDFALNQIDHGAGNEYILYAIWPAHDGSNGPFLTTLDDYTRRFKWRADYLTWKCHQLRPGLPPGWRVPIIPGNQMVRRLYDDVQAGLVPGVATFPDLFMPGDPIHGNHLLDYAIASLHATVGYQIDLREQTGVYIPPAFTDLDSIDWPAISPAYASYVWGVAHDIATSYEPCGWGGTAGAAAVFDPETDADPLAPVDPEPEPGELPTDMALRFTADSYTGPALTPALPAAADGYRTFTGAVHRGPLALTSGFYLIAAIRSADWTPATAGNLILAAPNVTNYSRPRAIIQLSSHLAPPQIFASSEYSGVPSPEYVHIGNLADATWQVVEGWIFGADHGGRTDAGADATLTHHGVHDCNRRDRDFRRSRRRMRRHVGAGPHAHSRRARRIAHMGAGKERGDVGVVP